MMGLLLWDNAADCQLLAFVRGIGGLRAGSLIFHGQPLLQYAVVEGCSRWRVDDVVVKCVPLLCCFVEKGFLKLRCFAVLGVEALVVVSNASIYYV